MRSRPPATANGARDNRHQIAHIQVVHPDDVPRFGALDATANIQALWACAEPQMTELTIPYLGDERSTWQYPFASIARAGGRLALGSDWPVTSPDPLQIMHVAVTRTEPGSGPDEPPFLPAERLSLDGRRVRVHDGLGPRQPPRRHDRVDRGRQVRRPRGAGPRHRTARTAARSPTPPSGSRSSKVPWSTRRRSPHHLSDPAAR